MKADYFFDEKLKRSGRRSAGRRAKKADIIPWNIDNLQVKNPVFHTVKIMISSDIITCSLLPLLITPCQRYKPQRTKLTIRFWGQGSANFFSGSFDQFSSSPSFRKNFRNLWKCCFILPEYQSLGKTIAEPYLSVRCHSQGESPYQCWAFSCTTMLRHSWSCFLDQLEETGNFSKSEIQAERAYIQSNEVFKEIKNLLMLIVVPKKMHNRDHSQSVLGSAKLTLNAGTS